MSNVLPSGEKSTERMSLVPSKVKSSFPVDRSSTRRLSDVPTARVLPSADQATALCVPGPWMDCRQRPDSTSQSFTVPSQLAVASILPSAENTMLSMASVCPLSTVRTEAF